MRSFFARAILAAALGGVVSYQAGAQAAPATAPAAPAPGDFKFPDFDSVTRGMEPMRGLFTLFRNKTDDPTKDQQKLLCQIPRSLLKQDLLLATSISRGPMAGFQWDSYLIRFEIVGRQVVITLPDARYVQTPGQPVNDAISRTYTDGYLAAMPIVTMAGADPVVDMGSALMSGMVPLPTSVDMILMGGSGGVMPRRELSQFSKVKVFPENALIDVSLAMGGRSGGQIVGISYDFRRLPAERSYSPRIADERVGYFTTVRQDWNIKHGERENLVRFVNRWDLKKKDPSLEMSPPEKPITFVLEKTIPLQLRKYIADGILEWNKSFEKLGIVNAIVVQQQTDDNEFANADPEDARYNFIRWIVTGRAFAMGPSRADPRTGQILDADIIIDDSMMRSYAGSMQVFNPSGATSLLGPEVAQFLSQNPSFIPAGQSLQDVQRAAAESSGELLHDMSGEAAIHPGRMRSAFTGCSFAAGLQHQLAFAQMASAAAGKKLPDRLLGEQMKMIVSHEVGHTLGLRHNFKASGWLGLDEIKRRRDATDEAPFASVMDYTPLLFFPGDDIEKVKHITSPTVGPYDHWAIEYGYKPVEGNEKEMLAKIASQCTKREYAFSTDEDTMGLTSPDPLSNRFDMGADPVAWAKMRITLCDALLKDLRKWGMKEGQPNHYLMGNFLTVLNEKSRNMGYVSRVVGGQYHNRNRPGDPDAKSAMVLLDPKSQRDAIDFLGQTIFSDSFFQIETNLLNELAASRWMDWASNPSARIDFPLHQQVSSIQSYVLLNLCSPQILQRVYDAELKTKAEDKFTAAELIGDVRKMVWAGVDVSQDANFTDAKPMISSYRRNLQKQHVQYLLAIAESRPGALVSPDLQSMVRFSLRELSEQLTMNMAKAAAGGVAKIDFASRAHLTECKAQIDRVLNAPYIQMPEPRGLMILGSEDGGK